MIRTEVYLHGRLTKIYDQIEVPNTWHDITRAMRGEARIPVVDGAHHWEIDGVEIAGDVAGLLLRHGDELDGPPPSSPTAA